MRHLPLIVAAAACVHPTAHPRAVSRRLPVALDAASLAAAVPSAFADGLAIHLATDRPLYRPGETVWLHAWALTGARLRPEDTGVMGPAGMRFDLVDPRGVASASILVDDPEGVARGALDLPEGAPGGLWTIRAVAHDGTVRERRIVVVPFEEAPLLGDVTFDGDGYAPGDRVTATASLRLRTGEPLAGRDVEAVLLVDGAEAQRTTAHLDADGASPLAFTVPEGASDATIVLTDGAGGSVARPVPIAAGPPAVGVYPEGGALVVGLRSRVYLELTDRHGEPVDASGRLVDGDGTVLTRFIAHRGRADVALVPIAGHSYAVEVDRAGAEPTTVPAAAPTGCVLTTRDDVDGAFDALRAEVTCSSPQDVTVFATLRGELLDAARVHVGADGATVDLLPATPALRGAQGVVTVTVLDDHGEPVAERVVYRNRGRDLALTLTPAADSAVAGQTVDVAVRATDPDGHPVRAQVLVAAVDDAWLSASDDDLRDVRSALLLEPTTGDVDDPARFLDKSVPASASDLDHLLGCRGWRRFRRVPAVEPLAAELPPPPPAGPAQNVPATDATAEGVALTKEFLQRIPAGRTYQTAVLTVPGIGFGGNPNMGGAATNENTYMLDGANVTDPMTGAFALHWGLAGVADPASAWAPEDDDILGMRKEYDACADRERPRTPGAGGTFTLSATIGGDGAVQRATANGAIQQGAVEACIARLAQRIRFPTGNQRTAYATVTLRTGEGAGPTPLPYTVVREFRAPAPTPTGVRTDFRPTIAWTLVDTGPRGEITAPITTTDAVTGFRIVAEGVGGGLVGRTDVLLPSRPPLSATARVPARLVVGDRVDIPIVLDNATDEVLSVALGAELSEERTLSGGLGEAPIPVPAHATVTAWLPVEAEATGDATVRITAVAGPYADATERAVHVEPRGFPRTVGATRAVADGVVEVALDTTGATPGSVRATVELAPGPSAALEGIEQMLGEPHGCFEQTSSTSYPNALILSVLRRIGTTDPKVAAHARTLVRSGLARIATFEVPTGGFSLWGTGEGSVPLSAYGLRQLVATSRVVRVDPALIDRISAWLLANRDGHGRFTRTGPVHGRTDDALTDLYATWGLAEAGHSGVLGVELDRAWTVGSESDDPYVTALAAIALDAAGRSGPADRLADSLATRQAADGSFPGASQSLTQSGGPDLLVETTALAVLALAQREPVAAGRARSWLAQSRSPYGSFGATQATVLALEALLTDASPGEGHVSVSLDGSWLADLVEPGGLTPAVLPLHLRGNRARIGLTGSVGTPATVAASYWTELPPDDAHAPLSLTTRVAAGPHRAGDLVRLTVEVHNRTGSHQPSPVARIGLPASLALAPWQIDDLTDHAFARAVEVGPGTVDLYWDEIGPDATLAVPLDLTAELPGVSTGAASSAWLYYGGDGKSWAPPVAVAIGR